MAKQCNKAETEKRVNEVYECLILRQSRKQILHFASKNWGEISDRQVENYIKKSRDWLSKELSGDLRQFLAEHIATRNLLFQEAFAAKKFQICLQILDSIARLQGLFDKQIRVIDDTWDSVLIQEDSEFNC